MKKATLIALLLGLASALWGQNIYCIFKTSQGVTLSNSTSSGTVATKRMEVKIGDMLNIPEGGEVTILEKSTRQVYTYKASEGCSIKVAKILIEAKKQASNNIAAINNGFITSIDERKLPGYNYSVQGSTYRGAGSDSTTAALYSALCKALEQNSTSGQLSLEMKQDGETFHFQASNSGNTPVYFNILRLGETPHICIPTDSSSTVPCLILDTKGTWCAKEISFVHEEGDKYIIFATDKPFNSQLLQQMFNRKQPADAQYRCTISIAPAIMEQGTR